MQKISICLFDPSNSTPWYDKNLSEALLAKGINVSLLTSKFQYPMGETPEYQRNALYPIANFLKLHGISRQIICGIEHIPGWVKVINWITKLNEPIIFHSQWLPLPIIDFLFLNYIKKKYHIPLVHTVHNLLPHKFRIMDRNYYLKIYQLVDQLIVHTEHTENGLIDSFGVGKDKISIIPHGIIGQDYPRISRSEARAKLMLDENPTILFFGALRKYKGLNHLINAFSSVQKSFPHAHLMIIGKPEDITQSEVNEWIYQFGINKSNLITRFEYIPDHDIPFYFFASDCVVYPYEKIDQSGALILGMTLGRPVIVTRVGGLSEIVVDNVNGIIIEPNDDFALANAILFMLHNPQKAHEFGENARQYLLTNFSWEIVAKKTIKVYEKLLRH